MLFASYNFIIFITVLFFVYYIIPKRFQWMLLLFASYVFYFFAGPKYIIYIAFTTISTYVVSIILGRIDSAQKIYLDKNKGVLSRAERRDYREGVKLRKRR
ncbi:MAG: MBOAT family protein, partial [Clostridiales bacterium]|nr:MBOAT family protein [Clostridiales bacterium]